MQEKQILAIFNKTNALLKGHFRLSSGLHSERYLQCALVLQHPEYAARLCKELAKKFIREKPSVVVAPAMGGIIVSYEAARALGCRSVFTERDGGEMTLRRGFDIKKSDRALVVEDVITTGGSTKEVIDVVKQKGAKLIGVGAIVDRSSGGVDFGVRFEGLVKLTIETFKESACPLCKNGIPVVKPGSRRQ